MGDSASEHLPSRRSATLIMNGAAIRPVEGMLRRGHVGHHSRWARCRSETWSPLRLSSYQPVATPAEGDAERKWARTQVTGDQPGLSPRRPVPRISGTWWVVRRERTGHSPGTPAAPSRPGRRRCRHWRRRRHWRRLPPADRLVRPPVSPFGQSIRAPPAYA